LLSLQLQMEIMELEYFEKVTKNLIDKPNRIFSSFKTNVLQNPFDGSLAVPFILSDSSQTLNKQLSSALELRRKELGTFGNPSVRATKADLDTILALGTRIVTKVFPVHILPRYILSEINLSQTAAEEQFWRSRQLTHNDWGGLTRQLFSKVFSDGFLHPLESHDQLLQLKVQHMDLTAYFKMLKANLPRDDLDAVTVMAPTADQLTTLKGHIEKGIIPPGIEGLLLLSPSTLSSNILLNTQNLCPYVEINAQYIPKKGSEENETILPINE